MYTQEKRSIDKGNPIFPADSTCERGGAREMSARVFFSFQAPDAEKVFLVGSFNNWSEVTPMRNNEGLWQASVRADEIHDGDTYKFKVYLHGAPIYVSDRNSNETDGEPYFNSIYRERFYRENVDITGNYRNIPVSMYEFNADAWAYGSDGNPLPYDMLSNELLPYILQMGYTHVVISGIFEPVSLAPQREQGGTDGLRKFIKRIHACRIGVLINVPETGENAHTVAERLAYWIDTLGADGVFIDLPRKRELEFYYELYSSLKRINSNVGIVSGTDMSGIIPADLSVRECADFRENTPRYLCNIASDATEILLGEGKMLTRAGSELGLSARSASVDWKKTDCSDCANLQRYLSDLNRVYLKNNILWSSHDQTKISFVEENGIRTTKREFDGGTLTVIRNLGDQNAEITLEPDKNHKMLISTNCDIKGNRLNLLGGAVCAVTSEKK